MLLQALCSISYPLVNSNWSYSPETPNLGQIRRFLEPCELEIWRMTFKNNRAPLLCYFKLCAAFHSHWWIQTGVTVRKCPIWVKFCDFSAVWPWNLTDDLEKQQGTSPKQHQAICIISSSYVNSNWSYSPETKIWVVTSVTLTFDLWPWPFAWTLPWSNVITPENFMMIRWWEHSQKGVTDGQTDRRTENTIHRAAWSQLKTSGQFESQCHDFHSTKCISKCHVDNLFSLNVLKETTDWGDICSCDHLMERVLRKPWSSIFV